MLTTYSASLARDYYTTFNDGIFYLFPGNMLCLEELWEAMKLCRKLNRSKHFLMEGPNILSSLQHVEYLLKKEVLIQSW